jgi:flagellar motor switch protein FliN/FliY
LLRRVLLEVTKACAARPEDERLDVTLNELTLTSGDAADDGEPAVVCAIGMAGLTEPLLVAARVVDGSALGAPDLSGGLDGSRVDVILDIDLPVVVRFGHTELSIRALSRLGPGSVIDLGRSPDDPVEVLVSNRVVAHGEVVIVGGNYGVRILDVASRSERVRSMEA